MIDALTDPYFLLAFAITSMLAVAFGWILVAIHEHSLSKHRQAPTSNPILFPRIPDWRRSLRLPAIHGVDNIVRKLQPRATEIG